jgi:hypothetical protein
MHMLATAQLGQASQLRQAQAAARQQAIGASATSDATRQKKLAVAQNKRDQFRFKFLYLLVPTLATVIWMLEFIDGGFITGIIGSIIVFFLRLMLLFFMPKDVKEFLIVKKKAYITFFFHGLLSYVLSIINVDMFMAWWNVIVTIPKEGRRIEKKEVAPLRG